jgi:hypothetical protein
MDGIQLNQFGRMSLVGHLKTNMFLERSTIFTAWLLADLIIRRLFASSRRYIFSPFNFFQQLSTLDLAMALKSVEMFSPATFRISLYGNAGTQGQDGTARS